MAIPKDHDIGNAAEALLRDHGGRLSANEVAEALARRFRLSAVELAQRMEHTGRPAGESVWKQKLRRVKAALTKSGVLLPERGWWSLRGV